MIFRVVSSSSLKILLLCQIKSFLSLKTVHLLSLDVSLRTELVYNPRWKLIVLTIWHFSGFPDFHLHELCMANVLFFTWSLRVSSLVNKRVVWVSRGVVHKKLHECILVKLIWNTTLRPAENHEGMCWKCVFGTFKKYSRFLNIGSGWQTHFKGMNFKKE